MRYRRTHSLDRAASLLPLLVRIAGEMTMRCRRIARLRAQYRESREGTREGAAPEGALERLRGEYEAERAAFEGCVREVEALGGSFVGHDPITVHLLGVLPGGVRVVLCWSLGERTIASFHPIGLEDGPRQPIQAALPPPPAISTLPAPSLRPEA